MFEKVATFLFKNIEPLNEPLFVTTARLMGINSEHISESLNYKQAFDDTVRIITASKQAEMEADGDATYFDLEAEIKNHPDSLYVKCFAIKADEMNDNGDFFAKEQLKLATPTFVGVPVFTNHQNTDAEAARGKVVHSWWNEDSNGIMIIARVDAEAYPQLARGIKEEYIAGTSMGCQVQYSICSICHNKAETPEQYCEHIRERKTRKIEAKNQKCSYHKHGDEKKCPLCSSKKGETKTYAVNEKAFEYNYGIKFIENSFVVNPACPECGVTEIIDPQQFLAKVADIQERLPGLLKAFSNAPLTCTDQTCIKIAGQKEIDDLNQALDLCTSVSQAMLQQKEQIDLEFLSDLVQVLADLQTVTDELTEQGYGRLQSPGDPGAEQGPPDPMGGESTGTPMPGPVDPTPGGGSKIQSGPAGGAGTVTSPMAYRKIDLKKLSNTLLHRPKKIKPPEKKEPKVNLPFEIGNDNKKLDLVLNLNRPNH